MVSDNFQRNVSIWIFIILNTSAFCSSLDDWENQISFKVCFAMLQHRRQTFKTSTSINIFMLQWFIRAIWHFIKLSEHEIPNFKVTITITAWCTVRIVTTMFRTLVKENFTIWSTRAFANFPEIIF